jgi:hypothetical protein
MYLGPFFTLKSFLTLKFFLHTKDNEFKAKMCNFCTNKGEEQNISQRGIYCTIFLIMMTNMKERSKLSFNFFYHQPKGKKEFQALFITHVFFYCHVLVSP